jgi:adenine-specific DNA-methyltransferase
VKIQGLDVYDPTTGEIRSRDSTDDIACWFIDTDYDGESFFVRHAYFTGATTNPTRNSNAPSAPKIDEAAWADPLQNRRANPSTNLPRKARSPSRSSITTAMRY